ncbi:MAG TPA: DUF4126 domain-containing protein [Terriglobales bacterium]|jgi:hypothetical protein|nr:DUF4126 domain-containing protein [Terriglobales bacterium]
MDLNEAQIISLVIGASFAAGLNVYAMCGTLGLLGHFQVVHLPPGLHVIENPWVIAVSLAMFVLHFFADKIPAFDLVWNSLHTFVRIPLAALVAYAATSQLGPGAQIASTALASVIAGVAHTGKFAARAAVTPSPEPVSNMALSVGEDVVAVGLTWFATVHPYWTAAIVAVLLIFTVILIRMCARAVRSLFARGMAFWRRPASPEVAQPPAA